MKRDIRVLSGNTLKIIAAVSMLIDHTGMLLLPNVMLLRILGRLAFPIFAFLIAEGCRYTKNKLKHFLSVLAVGVMCQVVILIYTGELMINVLITFSLSILVCYALENVKKSIFTHTSPAKITLDIAMLVALVATIFLINSRLRMEYGFIGCMLPPLASLFYMPSDAPSSLKRLDVTPVHVTAMGIGLLVFSVTADIYIQFFSLLALPLLLLYSGKRGKLRLKYFFYIFYPLHLLLLYGILILISIF